MRDRTHPTSSRWLWAAAATAFTLASAPALAQAPAAPTVEELTVTARIGPEGEVQSLSRPVSYADLDLTTEAGKTELNQRIETTARELCKQLGEPRTAIPPAPSCEQAAIDDTMTQARTAFAAAKPRTSMAAAPVAEPAAPAPLAEAPAATEAAAPASVTVTTVTNGPIPDTAENRRKYGAPLSRAGKRSTPAGN